MLKKVKNSKFDDIIEKDGNRSVIFGILTAPEEEEVRYYETNILRLSCFWD